MAPDRERITAEEWRWYADDAEYAAQCSSYPPANEGPDIGWCPICESYHGLMRLLDVIQKAGLVDE